MELVNIPTGNRPCVAHFPGPTREKDFQGWLLNEINGWTIPPDIPPHIEVVCVASEGVAESSPLVAQCKRFGIPLTILGCDMTDDEWMERRHFNKLYLLRKHISSGKAKPYLLVLDASDILLCGSVADIASAYHRHYDGKIVFGAEVQFMMKTDLWNKYVFDSGKFDLAHNEAFEIRTAFERDCRTYAEWKYLNGGMMIGQRDSIASALDAAIALAEVVPDGIYKCDQSIWMHLWHARKEFGIELDYECRMFQNLNSALPWDFCIDDKAEARKDDGTVDLLYAFCGDSTRDLSLSIALARKNLKNLGKIFVVGGNPKGVAGIEHIPFHDPNVKNREANMTRKCLLACNLSRISDPFIWTSDDDFILKPADARTLPLYQKGSLEFGNIDTVYGQRTRETYLECVRLGIPHLHYNTHVPLPIFKRKYIEAMQRIPWNTETGDGILCRSIYGNCVGKHEFIVDAKESAKSAIAALSVPFLSMPNNGNDALYSVIEAAAARI